MRFIIIACILALTCLAVTSARAQFTFVTPTPGGGYTVNRPGQSPTFVTPTPGGGYVINAPGQGPSFATPTPGGGYVINSPQQPRPSGIYGSPSGGMYGR